MFICINKFAIIFSAKLQYFQLKTLAIIYIIMYHVNDALTTKYIH